MIGNNQPLSIIPTSNINSSSPDVTPSSSVDEELNALKPLAEAIVSREDPDHPIVKYLEFIRSISHIPSDIKVLFENKRPENIQDVQKYLKWVFNDYHQYDLMCAIVQDENGKFFKNPVLKDGRIIDLPATHIRDNIAHELIEIINHWEEVQPPLTGKGIDAANKLTNSNYFTDGHIHWIRWLACTITNGYYFVRRRSINESFCFGNTSRYFQTL